MANNSAPAAYSIVRDLLRQVLEGCIIAHFAGRFPSPSIRNLVAQKNEPANLESRVRVPNVATLRPNKARRLSFPSQARSYGTGRFSVAASRFRRQPQV